MCYLCTDCKKDATMTLYLLIFSIIIITCVFLNKVSGKVGIPVLLFFLILGFICGSQYDEFVELYDWIVGDISTVALIFIMFYGGFGTRWKSAKPIAVEAGLMATFGVALTALAVGVFCHFILKWEWLESLLMGAVISSTDAATVFAILRTKKLGLKNNSAPLIEVESGSNDPMSYMLTTVVLSLMTGTVNAGSVIWDIVAQLVFGAGIGLIIATGAVYLLRNISFRNNGYDLLLFISIAMISYALPDLVGGNGYLSAYIVGIVLGNTKISKTKSLVSFFDAVTSLMQIIIFYLLGMLAIPSHLLHAIVPALLIFVFLTFVARPFAVYSILSPFRKYPPNQLNFISFVGLRGAASIVFAISILRAHVALDNDIFSIVFCIVLISIALQGSFIPMVARKTDMTDEKSDVMTTFSDFSKEADMTFGSIRIKKTSSWNGKMVKDLGLPPECLITLIVRDNDSVVAKGDTVIKAGDEVVLCARSYQNMSSENLIRHPLSENSKWTGHKVSEYPYANGSLLVMIERGDDRIIPTGDTVLKKGDILVILKNKQL